VQEHERGGLGVPGFDDMFGGIAYRYLTVTKLDI